MKKRILSFTLVLAMCLSLVSITALAVNDLSVKVTVEPTIYGPENGQSIVLAQCGVISVQKDGKWGLIDRNGKELTAFEYDEIIGFYDDSGNQFKSETGAAKKNEKWAIMDKTGKLLSGFDYDMFWRFSEDMATVMKDGKVGYVDTTGKLLIPLQYESGNDFHDGIAFVKDKDGWHGIDKTGKVVFSTPYTYLRDFYSGVAAVYDKNNKCGFIDKTGKVVIPFELDSGSVFYGNGEAYDVAWVYKNGKIGLIDKTGKALTAFEYDQIGNFYEGYGLAQKDGKWGRVDTTGKVVIPFEYENWNGQLHDGLFLMKKDGKWGYVDTAGKVVIPFEYEDATVFRNGYAGAAKDGKWGIIGKDAKTIIPFEYEGAACLFDGVLRLKKDGKWGLVDYNGKTLLPFEYNGGITIWLRFEQYMEGLEDIFILYNGEKRGFAVLERGSVVPDTNPEPAQPATAKPNASTVLVNGEQVTFDAYTINGYNYFKLRDLAFILNGTEKQFEVGWDGVNNAISLTSGTPYTVAGGEMQSKGAGDKTATPTNSKIYLDGKEVKFTAYTINGNNYFKLRDIGETFDFGVTWDGAKNTIVIDTSLGYTPE